MRVAILFTTLIALATNAPLNAQSGLKGIDLPPDPIIPIPLYHPRSVVLGESREPPGLLTPVEITASEGRLNVRAGFIRFSLNRIILDRSRRVLELSAEKDRIELRYGDWRTFGSNVRFNPGIKSLILTGDSSAKNSVFVGWEDRGLILCFH